MKKTYTNKPYKISISSKANFPNDGIADFERSSNSVEEYAFLEGESIDKEIPELQFEVSWAAKVGLEMDFWPNNSGSLLAGPRGIQFLQEFCPKDVQFFDARIRCKEQEVTTYKLVNLTHKVDSIDYAKSECTYFKDETMMWPEKVVFKDDCMGAIHIAREEKFKTLKICSPEFVKEYKKRKLKGLKFVEDDAYLLGQESFRKED